VVCCGIAVAILRSGQGAGVAPELHVSGNMLIDAQGKQVVLHGVDRAGAEYMCVNGRGIFDGPSDSASILPMKNWHINAVRLPLNEACWNGDSYVESRYSGSNYQHAIEAYVKLLNSEGMVVILDLHLSDGRYTGPSSECSSWEALCGKPMPDTSAVKFWKSIANAFKDNDSVIFDLFNEPYPDRALGNDAVAWRCWLDGGSACSPGISYPAVGMQALVDTVRSTGANNVMMLGGISWAHNLIQWLNFEPKDPDHDLVASWHSYNTNPCNTRACWNRELTPVLARVPIIAGEIGMNGCAVNYITKLTSWLDLRSTSYFAWAWNVASGSCSEGSDLVTNYDGAPTPYGAAYRSHLQSLANH
jgi:endoglucanase